jgi:hypothetical protein
MHIPELLPKEKSTMATRAVGRPKADVETVVVAVRISTELRDRLDHYIDLATRRGEGTTASKNSVIGYAIKYFLDAKEKDKQKNIKKVRQEPQKRPATPVSTGSVAIRQELEKEASTRKKLKKPLRKNPAVAEKV